MLLQVQQEAYNTTRASRNTEKKKKEIFFRVW